jgi:phosphohistidine phosphatase
MQLLIIRHAIAEDRDTFARTGRDDGERPLTRDGRRRMVRGAKGLRRAQPRIDLLAASPFARAAETAAIVAGAYGGLEMETADDLLPSARYKDMLRWLRARREAGVVAVVGHEPHLSGLATLLLTGKSDRPVLELKKGAACRLDFADDVGPAKATLRWALAPGQLRRLRS